MKEYEADFDIRMMYKGRLDFAIEALLTTLLAFMPFAFGADRAWSKEVVIALSGMIVVCFLLKVLHHGDQGLIGSWSYLLLALFVLVAVFQLIPFSTHFVRIISPNTIALRQELLGDLPGADTLLKTASLSFYANATRHDLRLIVSIAAVFVVTVNFFRSPDQIKRLLMTIALIGGIVAAFTLIQFLFRNGKIYWFIDWKRSQAISGPFVNHNNYAQFMNLSIGAALGCILVSLHEYFAGRKVTPFVIYDYLSSRSAKFFWLLVIIVTVGIATIFISLSRGGMVSLLIASVFMTLLLVSRPSLKGRGWIMAIIALGAFACILFVGFDAVYARYGDLSLSMSLKARMQIMRDLVSSYGQFPVLGTGLGTHAVVYPMFKQINDTTRYQYADNEYAQLLEEAGLVGFIILLVFGVIIFWNFLKNIRYAKSPIHSAAYGLGFGLIAILIQSVSDYGQHLPANAFLTAIFCALLVSLAHQNKTHATFFNHRSLRFRSGRIFVVFFLMLGFGIFWIWALVGADRARRGEACWAKVRSIKDTLVRNRWHGTEAEFADLVSGTRAAFENEPDNVRYRYWYITYRWRLINRDKKSETSIEMLSEDEIREVRDCVEQLYQLCFLCPLYGPPYSLAGQIQKFVFSDPNGSKRIRQGFRLAPSDPATCFTAARLDVFEGRIEDSIPKFEKAVHLNGGLFRDVARILVYQISKPLSAISIAGENVGRLNEVASMLDDMMYLDLSEQVRGKIKELLKAECSDPDASPSVFAQLGSIYSQEGNGEKAIECYRQALAREYAQTKWRLELARILNNMNKIPEAMTEAKICLQLQPQFAAAKTLVEELSVHPALLSEKAASD